MNKVGGGNKGWGEGGLGFETRQAGINRMSGVSLGRIRKQRMRNWLDGEMSRGRDRRTGLNK